MKANFKFYFGHNIPRKNLQVYKIQSNGESVLIQGFNSQLSVSKEEFKNFLRQFNFLTGYSLIQCCGMYEGEEEESSILEVFSIEKSEADQIANKYIADYLQEGVICIQTSPEP